MEAHLVTYPPLTVARFWSKVDVGAANACWEWKAKRVGNGYGGFRIPNPRKTKRAHVIAYELVKGDIPEGMLVCHECDNRLCCNPKHLWLGTHSDNAVDAFSKGRLHMHCQLRAENGNAKLDEVMVERVKLAIAKGETNVAIAKWAGVHHSMISRIRLGKNWS